jgi:hypothetical protein
VDIEPAPCRCLLCQPPTPEDQWDPRDSRIAHNIRETGWHIMGVTGDDTPDWAYSIGMWHTLSGPDICMTGLPVENAMSLIWKIAMQVRDEGRGLAPEKLRLNVIEGYKVAIRPVHPTWYPAMFGAGLNFYQTPPWPLLQAIWPDRQGRFPWEEGADPERRDQQPFLWLDRNEHPDSMWVSSALSL